MLCSRSGKRALKRAAELIGDAALEAAVAGLDQSPETSLDELTRTYDRIFGHTLRGRVCPYETEYGVPAPFRQSQELSDIAGYYRAFGLEPAIRERIDHISYELDFAEFLLMKEVYALEQGDQEMLEATRAAERSFLLDHLGRFGPSLGASLMREAGESFYGRLGGVLTEFLTRERTLFGIAERAELLTIAPVEPDNIPMACASGDDTLVHIDVNG
jgi:TorA maturation chaperone TorD